MIYTWLQVNGVSVTDPSLPDLLFLLMSASLDSFFIFTLLSSERLFPSVSSLLKEKKKTLPSQSFTLAVSSFGFLFFFPFSHTHIPSLPLASSGPSNLLPTLVSGLRGDQSHDSMALITDLAFRVKTQESL